MKPFLKSFAASFAVSFTVSAVLAYWWRGYIERKYY